MINISGRGDKDVDTAIRYFGIDGSVDDVAGRMETDETRSQLAERKIEAAEHGVEGEQK